MFEKHKLSFQILVIQMTCRPVYFSNIILIHSCGGHHLTATFYLINLQTPATQLFDADYFNLFV